jgi:hypothetical protein
MTLLPRVPLGLHTVPVAAPSVHETARYAMNWESTTEMDRCRAARHGWLPGWPPDINGTYESRLVTMVGPIRYEQAVPSRTTYQIN